MLSRGGRSLSVVPFEAEGGQVLGEKAGEGGSRIMPQLADGAARPCVGWPGMKEGLGRQTVIAESLVARTLTRLGAAAWWGGGRPGSQLCCRALHVCVLCTAMQTQLVLIRRWGCATCKLTSPLRFVVRVFVRACVQQVCLCVRPPQPPTGGISLWAMRPSCCTCLVCPVSVFVCKCGVHTGGA